MELLRHPNMPSDYLGNGCGPDGWKGELIPDRLGGINVSEPCGIHDYDFEVGGSEEDFNQANKNFLFNMLTVIHRDDTWLTNEDVAVKWASKYYLAICEYGREYFNFHE